ncbi:hypothetical protein K8I28_04575 [bacterium]|nr:hypothetical protein [bacterium]
MRYINLQYLLLSSILTILFTPSAFSQNRPLSDIKHLQQLNGVRVEVKKIDPVITNSGVTKSNIEHDVKVLLTAAGLQVYEASTWEQSKGKPYIYVGITTAPAEQGFYALNVRVDLKEKVKLERNGLIFDDATVWELGFNGIASAQSIRQVRDIVKDMVRVFTQDYLRAQQQYTPPEK